MSGGPTANQENVEMNDNARPTGLTVLAVIQFVFCIALLAAFATSPGLSVYGVLSPLITGLMMVGSGIGYLRQDYKLGLIGGNILGIGSLANILIFSTVQGFENFAVHIPSLIYPVVLLGLLNLRYKDAFTFRRSSGTTAIK